MGKQIFKIGDEISVEKETLLSGFSEEDEKVKVKPGDVAIVKDGCIKWVTGEARNNIQMFSNSMEVKGYNTENIVRRIVENLKCIGGFEEALEYSSIEEKEIYDTILDELSEFI